MPTKSNEPVVMFRTDDMLTALCDSVAHVLSKASASTITYAATVQRITKTCLKPDIGCFVLFDGGFSGLVVMNFPAPTAMELYQSYMLSMGMPREELASAHTSDEVSNIMGELMNQTVGDFTSKVRRELQTHITQSQPKMLVLNKQVVLSIDTHLERPEARRVTFYTSQNHVFYLELAIDRVEFVKLRDFEAHAVPNPDELLAQVQDPNASAPSAPPAAPAEDHEALLRSLGL